MAIYDLRFDKNNVLQKFQQIRQLPGEQKEDVLSVLQHELCSDVSVAVQEGFFFGESSSRATIHQRAYVHGVCSSGRLIMASLLDLFRYCRADENPFSGMDRASGRFVERVQEVACYLPATQRVLELGTIAPEQQEALERVDLSFGMAFYTYNLGFARTPSKEVYHLREDVRNFFGSQFSGGNGVNLDNPQIMPLESRVDYFSRAVLPLIKNVQQHAFHPENDVYGRLGDPAFRRTIEVSSTAKEAHQLMIFTIQDNGFGMRPEIQERLFERGVSTKTDNETEHGVGLWAIKEFVENLGGKIWVETELGRGTSFHFTITYTTKNHFMYVQ